MPSSVAAATPSESFEKFIAAETASPERSRIVPLEARRAAFETFARMELPGGKPGRDWKYDYGRLAASIPWNVERSGAPPPYAGLLPAQMLAASARASYPFVAIEPYDPQGARVSSLRDLDDDEQFLRRVMLGRAVRGVDDPFANLTRAFASNGVLVHVPAGVHVERPIAISHSSAADGFDFPYTLVVLDAGAQATVIEDVTGSGFTSGIVEIVVGERATLDFLAIQRTESDARVISNRAAVCAADSTCRFFVAELGGALSRSVVTTRLEGRGATAEISAFFFNAGDQHVDLSTLVDHASGDTTSRTIVKSCATDRGQGRYLGNIRIAAHANGSDAALRDDALLLSKRAHIDSVPALEIASNDVKAFHGATVGSIDEDELFYAQSRGIDRADAERMIALGFFEPVVAAFPLEQVRAYLRDSLGKKLVSVGAVEDAA